MSHAKILIRALPNVEFVHGFPGIPAGPDRPQATIRGAVEVRLGSQPVKAKYVKVELRKIETIPGGNRGEEFVDLVGQNPITVWEAQGDHDTLSAKDFPFNIRVPETIPPSVALERGAGIKYEVVATLCTKGKKFGMSLRVCTDSDVSRTRFRGLFRREASNPMSHTVSVVIDKHELHSTWPIYAQPETRHTVSNGLTLAVDRSNTCFAPGDRLSIIATLKSDNLLPVVLRGFEFSLRETIIYRGGPQSHSKKNGPLVQTSVLGEQKLPVSMSLYCGTKHEAELACVIPGNHTTSSVNAGRHIDIGYLLNIKAIIDAINPIIMDLPVTITNWPRHVSADMIRRIGTAPNLTLNPATSPRPIATSLVHTAESRPKYGPPHPPPSGSLPSLPNGSGPPRSVPPGALVSGPPGSPNLGQYATSINPYSFQQNPYSTVVGQTLPQPNAAPPSEVATATSGDTPVTKNPGIPNEFGYTRQSSAAAATVPSHQGERPDFSLIDVTQGVLNRSANSQSASDLDTSGLNIVSQYSQDSHLRANVVTSPASSTGRRARGMSRALKIMNANDDIPEEESPDNNEASPRPFDSAPLASVPQRPDLKSTTPSGSSPSISPWPTADEEKQRLYETAKAKAQKVQAFAKAGGEGSSQAQTPRSSNGHVSPPRQASPTSINKTGGERPRTASPSFSRTPWPTAEEEKQELFERAQAKVRRIQALVNTPSSSPAAGSAAGPATHAGHHRTTSSHSSQDPQVNRGLAAASTSVPTISAGAALYSHAMASINRSASTMHSYTSPTNTSAPRRNVSHTGSGGTVSGSGTSTPTRQVSAEEGSSALLYYEARNAVQRQQLIGGNIPEATPQEGPIPYEELFGSGSEAYPATGPSANEASPRFSEKETMRRAYEARDAEAATHTPPAAAAWTVAAHRSPSIRGMTPPAGPSTGLSEKEVLRRAFEARDAAIMRSGQTPPPVSIPLRPSPPPVQYSSSVAASLQPTSSSIPPVQSPPPAPSPPLSSGPSSAYTQTTPRSPPSEKERMRLAFEARDRALAAQQALLPPGYDKPSPSAAPGPPGPGPIPPVWSESNGGPLSAAEEKAQLKANYVPTDADAGRQSPSSAEKLMMAAQSEALNPPVSPTRAPSHKSHKSDTSETFLRRDPTISAGKKRASQMIAQSPSTPPPPPPLPPHPPAEYIEETKLEDRRNTLVGSVTLPPSDFSSSFDLGFDSFSPEFASSERRSG